MRDRLPWILAGVTLVLHAAGNPHYGFFRDELYFIICGRRPDWGYVDQPPLAPLLAAGSQLFGTSLFALRLVPAACAGATVFVTCLVTREIGGGRFAQALASICVAFAPVLASFGMKLSPDSFEMILWPLAAYYSLRALRRSEPRSWLGAGLALGAAFEAKYSVALFAFAMLAGLLAAGAGPKLRNRWFASGIALALAIALPNALWQFAHGFPMWELLRNGAAGKNVVLSPQRYLEQQLLLLNPLLSAVWIVGVAWAFVQAGLRWFGYAFVFLIALMIALHAKDYYPTAVYPIAFAAGSCAIERWTRSAAWSRPLVTAGALVAGAALVPLVMPVLPITAFIAYQRALHVTPTSGEHTRLGVLPQEYADMLGWPEMTAALADIYDSLSPRDRARTILYTANYGEAAAVDFFGAPRQLPPAASHHNQYYLWGLRGYAGTDALVISINVSQSDLRKAFRSVRLVREYAGEPLARPLERDDPICISSGLKRPWPDTWAAAKLYI